MSDDIELIARSQIIWLHRRLADTRSLGCLQEWSLSVLADTSCADAPMQAIERRQSRAERDVCQTV
uniref:hypothetical protein n=1 Tax=Burkholderia diffusa TaxID=488732 RepID=UPI001CC5BEEA|nr:hypothetical protein [Burkholderia diffusa]